MADKTLADLRARKAELLAELSAVDDKEAELKESYEKRRNDALHVLACVAMDKVRDSDLSLVSVHEGVDLSQELLDHAYKPQSGNQEMAVQMYSARERKGYINPDNRVDGRNPSYRGDEMVIFQFVFPRKDFEVNLTALELLTKEKEA
jgi:hypothetical protein